MFDTSHLAPARVPNRRLPSAAPSPHPSLRTVHRALLRVVQDAGEINLDALVRAIPNHPRPLSAIMTLVDAGLIDIDRRGAFDATTRLRPAPPG